MKMKKNISKNIESYINQCLKNIPGCIYCKNRDGKYIACSDYLLKSSKFSNDDQVIGKTDYDLFVKEQARSLRKNDLEVINNGKTITMEEIITLPNGENQYFEVIKTPFKNEKDEIIGIMGNSVDVTHRKKMEIELKQVKEKAELANKAKTEFLYNMRHDLRTALNGIQGLGELIKQEAHDKKISEYADNLVISCRALTNIHNQILHAAHVFSGDVPLYKSKFNPCTNLQQVLDLHLAKACEKGLKLILECDKKIPKYLLGDRSRFSGIALELLTNALKYTNHGSICIKMVLEKKQKNQVIVKLIVKDTGIGISDDKKAEIFNWFNRVNPSYEGKYKGLGLGLSIVKQFIDDLGGEIYVSSSLNQGSTFTCHLPFAVALSLDDEGVDDELMFPEINLRNELQVQPLSPLLAMQKPHQGAKPKQHKGYSILLVEDDELSAMVADNILVSLGYRVQTAVNGVEALKQFKANNYDLLFMDVGLPDFSGNEVTRKIRAYEKSSGKHVPIIALTAHVDGESKRQCIEAGMDAVLVKPLIAEQASKIINTFVLVNAKNNNIKAKKITLPSKNVENSLLHIVGKVFDQKALVSLLGGAQDKVMMILRIAVPGFAEELITFKSSYKDKNWQHLIAVVHKMAGKAISCSASRVYLACHNLELYLKKGKRKLAPDLYNLVLVETNKLLKVLKKIVGDASVGK